MEELYIRKYGEGPFIPKKLEESIEGAHRAKLSGASLIMDKNATPSEPLGSVAGMEASMRPLHLLAARSTQGASSSHFEHAEVFARYQELEIQTSSTLLDQFDASYLGCAMPFTLPVAVGGYDVPGKPRWRRPEARQDGSIPAFVVESPFFTEQKQVAPASVKLFDITRGLPQRVEAQYRRHWSFAPGLWSLYFREQINLGASLGAVSRGSRSVPQD